MMIKCKGNIVSHFSGEKWKCPVFLKKFMGTLIKIGTGIQAILRFCLRNSRGCNAGITDGRDV
jgi:hypothetical protein